MDIADVTPQALCDRLVRMAGNVAAAREETRIGVARMVQHTTRLVEQLSKDGGGYVGCDSGQRGEACPEDV